MTSSIVYLLLWKMEEVARSMWSKNVKDPTQQDTAKEEQAGPLTFETLCDPRTNDKNGWSCMYMVVLSPVVRMSLAMRSQIK